MAKKIVAVTGIKHSKGFVNSGETLNPADFTKEELRSLHDSGAVIVVDDSKADDLKGEPTPETPEVPETTEVPETPEATKTDKDSTVAPTKSTTAAKK